MNTKFVNALSLFLALSVFSFGNVFAQENVSDQQYCQQEAQDAGMSDADEVREYIAQCLKEVQSQNSGGEEAAASASESESQGNDQ